MSHAVQCYIQRWKIFFHYWPDRIQVNAKVAVHDQIAKAGQLALTNLRLGTLKLA